MEIIHCMIMTETDIKIPYAIANFTELMEQGYYVAYLTVNKATKIFISSN